MKTRPCLKCKVDHDGKYPVCKSCIEGINSEWTQNAKDAIKKLQEVK